LGFELVVIHPDGRQTTEQLADSAALNRRALELQRELLADSWFISSDPRR
jgi:hypothetical protein